jgi:hypothetical protein
MCSDGKSKLRVLLTRTAFLSCLGTWSTRGVQRNSLMILSAVRGCGLALKWTTNQKSCMNIVTLEPFFRHQKFQTRLGNILNEIGDFVDNNINPHLQQTTESNTMKIGHQVNREFCCEVLVSLMFQLSRRPH